MENNTVRSLIKPVHEFAGTRILAVGDLMLDEYIQGVVRRVSPEAPVPVIEYSGAEHVLGGAGNVAANIAALGGAPALIGVVGEDADAALLRRIASAAGVAVGGLVADPARPTTKKTRVLGNRQQVVRIDIESTAPLAAGIEAQVVAQIRELLPSCRACVVSDYEKGAVTELVCQCAIKEARALGIPVVVDPKVADFAKYRDSSVITPNLVEAARATGVRSIQGEAGLAAAAAALLGVVGSAALLLTQGSGGMTLFRRNQPAWHAAALAKQVFDVTGAGDTVVATLALGLAAGLPLEAAAGLSNLAASLAVQKPGTRPVFQNEILEVLTSQGFSLPS